MLTTVLFDLDGTLLPMDQELFTKTYFKLLAAKLAPHGYEPEKLIDGVWKGTAAMVKNDGSRTNEEAFWSCFSDIFGENALKDKPIFNDYYENDFQNAASVCGFNGDAKKTVDLCLSLKLRIALATNPIFPSVATLSRARWAGLEPGDFELITTYENSVHCKPNSAYFTDIAAALGCRAESCLMVGNDADEDYGAVNAGMELFILTDCLINKSGRDLSSIPHGGFADLMAYIKNRVKE